jgi:hypothetical protein
MEPKKLTEIDTEIDIDATIKRYTEIIEDYPEGHSERKKIMRQIELLKKRNKKNESKC